MPDQLPHTGCSRPDRRRGVAVPLAITVSAATTLDLGPA